MRQGLAVGLLIAALTSWYRWTTLVLLAHLFLAITTTVAERAKPTPAGLIPLSLNEIPHLFTRLVIHRVHDMTDCLCWSWWRRRHQDRAQQAHYQRLSDQEP